MKLRFNLFTWLLEASEITSELFNSHEVAFDVNVIVSFLIDISVCNNSICGTCLTSRKEENGNEVKSLELTREKTNRRSRLLKLQFMTYFKDV